MITTTIDWKAHVEAVAAGEPGSLVLTQIVWLDASAFAIQWTDTIDPNPRLSLAVGWVVAESDDAISIVALLNPDQMGHGITIPKSMIVSWKDL